MWAFKMSVIMPTWNRVGVIERALDSILKQTYKCIEIIVVDDGSTDQTENLVREKYMSCQLPEGMTMQYIKTPKNGVSFARNAGLKSASGDIIAYLDSDNEWLPYFAEKMVNLFAENCDTQCAYAALETKNVGGIGNFSLFKRFDRVELLYQNFIDMNVFVHRRSLFERHGGFSVGLKRLVDWDLILRYTKEEKPGYIKEVLAHYYIDSRLNHITHKENLRANLEQIIRFNFPEIRGSQIPSLLEQEGRALVWSGTLAQPEWHSAWVDIWHELLNAEREHCE